MGETWRLSHTHTYPCCAILYKEFEHLGVWVFLDSPEMSPLQILKDHYTQEDHEVKIAILIVCATK